MAFAGAPGSIIGTLGATIALEGTGVEMEKALRTAHGVAVLKVTDGTVAGLSLVPTLVVATSGRGGYAASAQRAQPWRHAALMLGALLIGAVGFIVRLVSAAGMRR